MLYCCERMYPNYVLFSREMEWGAPQTIRSALDDVWNALESDCTRNDWVDVMRACEAAAPDTEVFDSTLVSAALDAASSASILVDAMSHLDQTKFVEVASLGRDSVDLYVQQVENMDPNHPGLEELILAHPLMQKELGTQTESLDLLADLEGDHRSLVRTLRKKWANLKEGCLGITIEAPGGIS